MEGGDGGGNSIVMDGLVISVLVFWTEKEAWFSRLVLVLAWREISL